MLELAFIILTIVYLVSLVVLENSQTFVGRTLFFVAMIPVAPFLIAFYSVMWVLEPWLMRSKCPACSKRQMVIAYGARSNPPRPTLYLCLACGARRERLLSGTWRDASDSKFDERYNEFEEFRRRNPSIHRIKRRNDGCSNS